MRIMTKQIVILATILCTFPACKEDAECDNPGESWCTENRIATCHPADEYIGKQTLDIGIDCIAYGAQCVEVSNGDKTEAACALTDESCGAAGTSHCVSDDMVAVCNSKGQLILYGCSGLHCVDSVVTGGAVCAWIPGICSEGDKICWANYAPSGYLKCEDGAWTKHSACHQGCNCPLLPDTDEEGSVDAGLPMDTDTGTQTDTDSGYEDDRMYEWHTFFGSASYDYAYSILSDAAGDLYIGGVSRRAWFGPQNEDPLNPYVDDHDLFILKLSSNGSYLWHTFFGAMNYDTCFEIVMDSHGDIYAVGSSLFNWFGPAGEEALNKHSREGQRESFVLKLDADGNYKWHTFFGGQGEAYANAVTVDENDSVYVSGLCKATWEGPSDASPLNQYHSSQDIFILKLNSDGSYQWHTFWGAGGDDISTSITWFTPDKLLVTGSSESSWTGPENQEPRHAFAGASDAFVVALDETGNYQWHAFFGGDIGYDHGKMVVQSPTGTIQVLGTSNAPWTGDDFTNPINEHSGTGNLFLLELDENANYQWHTFFNIEYRSESPIETLAHDTLGNIYITGSSYDMWNGPAGEEPHHVYRGDSDVFVLSLDVGGAYQWHTFNGSKESDAGRSIIVNNAGGIFVTGTSNKSWTGPFGAGPIHEHSGTYTAYNDILILKLKEFP